MAKSVIIQKTTELCPECGGQCVTEEKVYHNRWELRTCPTCKGEGTVSKTVEITVPMNYMEILTKK